MYQRSLQPFALELPVSEVIAVHNTSITINLTPDYADAYKARAFAYDRLGKTTEAEADFKKYEELTGEKP